LRLNPEGLFLCSMLQLQMRLQVGLGIDELYRLLEASGFHPSWSERFGDCQATLAVRLSDDKVVLLECRANAISLH
jgi:hypothetical protein